jgi:hypothetical protein
MTFLTRNDTEETSFYNRIAQQRKDHEAALDRLEAKLQTLQQRREARESRECTITSQAASMLAASPMVLRRAVAV